jgi:hypothetical protein
MGQRVEHFAFILRRLVRLSPVGADGGHRIVLSDRHHEKAANEGGTVGILRDARILADVGDGHRFAMEHGPARNAGLERKTPALPQGGDGIFFGIEAVITLAQYEGNAVGSGDRAGTAAHGLCHFVEASSGREPGDGGNQRGLWFE